MPLKPENIFHESHRKSIFDGLRENLKVAHRNNYVHRLIYIGEHMFADVSKKSIDEVFEKVIKSINDHYCDEKLSGFLLYYQRYFCHVIEGSEEMLIKHLKLIIQNDAINCKLGRLKLLVAYHHINQRFLNEWSALTSKPTTLLETLSPTSNLAQTMSKVIYCIRKLYLLGIALRPEENVEEEESEEEEKELISKMEFASGGRRDTNIFGDEMNPLVNFLPEYSILEFLLESQHVPDLRQYLTLCSDIRFLDSYEDLVWPVPCDFIPMNIFDRERDPVIDLPEEKI